MVLAASWNKLSRNQNSLRLKIYVDFDIYGQISIMQMFPQYILSFLEISTTACLPQFGLTYIIYIGYQSCFWLLSQGSEEIYIYTFFFSDSWCFCDLVLSVKFDDQKCIMKSPFFQMCLSDRTSLKLLQQHYGKTKSEFLFWVEKSFFNKEIWHFLIQNQPCPK